MFRFHVVRHAHSNCTYFARGGACNIPLAKVTPLVYEDKVRALAQTGELARGDIVILAADRADGKTYSQMISTNVFPTLTCNNRYIWIADVSGILDNLPDAQREFWRFPLNCERLSLQGFPPEVALDLSPASALKAAGNAYPPVLLIVVLHGMLEALAVNPEFDLATWPPATALSKPDSCEVGNALRAFEQDLRKQVGRFSSPSSAQKKKEKATYKSSIMMNCVVLWGVGGGGGGGGVCPCTEF